MSSLSLLPVAVYLLALLCALPGAPRRRERLSAAEDRDRLWEDSQW